MASLLRMARLPRGALRPPRSRLAALFSFGGRAATSAPSSSAASRQEFAPLAAREEDVGDEEGLDVDDDALERGDGGRSQSESETLRDDGIDRWPGISAKAKAAIACNGLLICIGIGFVGGLSVLLVVVLLVALVVFTERRGSGEAGHGQGGSEMQQMQQMAPGVLAARHVTGRRLLRAHMLDPVNARLSMVDRDFTAEDYEALLALDSQESTDGAAQQQIDRLPSHTVTQAMLDSASRAGEKAKTCSICLENLLVGAHVRTLPCLHQFHMGCIDTWLLDKALCPVCKMDCFA